MDAIQRAPEEKITYEKCFWLFFIGSFLGVLIEGVFCLIAKGRWETHVVTMWGHFNILYGAGAVLFYVFATILKSKSIWFRSFCIMCIATVLELLCGLYLRNILGMKAWDYSTCFLNYKGIICPTFALGWGVAAFAFCCVVHSIDRVLCRCRGKGWRIACFCLSLFMAVNLALTAVSIHRWSDRYYGFTAVNSIETFIDKNASDLWMQHRFIEWSFLEKAGTNNG